MIDVKDVKALREMTKASYADCKNALVESNGDLVAAETIVRNKGHAIIDKRTVDNSVQGIVHSYIHPGGRIGVLVEVKCNTDFVAKTEEFKQFVKEIAMQIAAMKPKFISRADIPLEVISNEVSFRMERLRNDGADESSDEFSKLLDAEMELWYSEVCLLEQTYIKDNKKRVQDLLAELITKVNETCRVSKFDRWEIGNTEEKEVEQEDCEYIKSKGAGAFFILFAIISFISFICGYIAH